jgi:hypothetical protein
VFDSKVPEYNINMNINMRRAIEVVRRERRETEGGREKLIPV